MPEVFLYGATRHCGVVGHEKTLERFVQSFPHVSLCSQQNTLQPPPFKGHKRGIGCFYQIDNHLWEGKYSLRDAHGKRISRNVYAQTKEEFEKKLMVMIEEMNKEIAAERKNNNTCAPDRHLGVYLGHGYSVSMVGSYKMAVHNLYVNLLRIDSSFIISSLEAKLIWGSICEIRLESISKTQT